MEIDSTLPWLVLAMSLVGFFLASLGQTSLTSVRRERVQWLVTQGVRGSLALDGLHSTPMGPAGTLSLLKASLLASSLLSGAALVSDWGPASLVAVGVFVLLGILHIAARTLAGVYGERIALRVAFLVRGLARILAPVLAIETTAMQRGRRSHTNQTESLLEAIPTELSISIDADGETLDEREVRMIRGVVQLDKTTAREIMVPRVDMVAAERRTSLAQLVEQMVESGHSRVPIYDDSLDRIEGIAYARDILGHLSRNDGRPGTLTDEMVRPALFIPETKTLEELLNEFQERRVHIAMVVDEYGGVSGMVTIEDLLEEIVGEINDEFDVGEPEIQGLSGNEFLMDARVSIDQLAELLQVAVEGDGFDTVGGFVYQRLGKIPSSGDTVEYDGLRIEVVSTVGRRIKRLRVTRSLEDPGALEVE